MIAAYGASIPKQSDVMIAPYCNTRSFGYDSSITPEFALNSESIRKQASETSAREVLMIHKCNAIETDCVGSLGSSNAIVVWSGACVRSSVVGCMYFGVVGCM
jgi:hypothetical protein